jgi:hypothetical protein
VYCTYKGFATGTTDLCPGHHLGSILESKLGEDHGLASVRYYSSCGSSSVKRDIVRVLLNHKLSLLPMAIVTILLLDFRLTHSIRFEIHFDPDSTRLDSTPCT